MVARVVKPAGRRSKRQRNSVSNMAADRVLGAVLRRGGRSVSGRRRRRRVDVVSLER